MGGESSKSNPEPKSLEQQFEKELDECVHDGVVDKDKLFDVLDRIKKVPVNIAILGEAGCGKSSLINILIKATPPNSKEEVEAIKQQLKECPHNPPSKCKHSYAPTNSSECTTRATPFTFQNEDDRSVIIWDLPGYGAKFYRDVEDYFKEFQIVNFDALVFVLRDNRVFENTELVLRKLTTMNKEFIIVRTHFDSAVKRDFDLTPEEKKAMFEEEKKKAHEVITKELGHEIKDLYAVSGKYVPKKNLKNKFEIDELKESLLEKLPTLQQIALGSAFDGWTERILDAKFRKVQYLTAICVFVSARFSAETSLIPIVNIVGACVSGVFDMKIIHDFKKQVAKIYNFTEDGHLLDPLSVDEKTKEFVDTQLAERTSFVLKYAMAGVGNAMLLSTIGEAGFGLIPFLGTALSATISGSFMAGSCHKINTVYYNAALEVMNEMKNQKWH